MRYRFTHDALAALDAITHYIALDNEKAAARVTSKVMETCELLGDMPHIGRHPDYIEYDETYCYPVKKYHNI